MEGPLAAKPVAACASPFATLPFLTDSYLSAPQCAAAAAPQQQQQLLLLQGTQSDQTAAAAAQDRLSASSAEGWGDPSRAAAMHLLGDPRDGDGNDMLPAVQDPNAFPASCFGSYVLSPSSLSMDPSGGGGRSLSPTELPESPETGSSSFVGSVPSGGFPLYYGPTFSFSPPNPLACCSAQEGPLGARSGGAPMYQQNAPQASQGLASDYDRFTKELGKYCASLKELVTENPSFSDELNSTLETAIQSAGQVTRVQRKLLLSMNQQKQLVADSKLIQSKVHMLHRILQKTAPQYNQWLEKHAVLRDHMQQLEHHYTDSARYTDHVRNENTSDNIRNCIISRRSSSSSNKRRSARQYKRQHQHQHLLLQRDSSKGFLLPGIKSELASSCL